MGVMALCLCCLVLAFSLWGFRHAVFCGVPVVSLPRPRKRLSRERVLGPVKKDSKDRGACDGCSSWMGDIGKLVCLAAAATPLPPPLAACRRTRADIRAGLHYSPYPGGSRVLYVCARGFLRPHPRSIHRFTTGTSRRGVAPWAFRSSRSDTTRPDATRPQVRCLWTGSSWLFNGRSR